MHRLVRTTFLGVAFVGAMAADALGQYETGLSKRAPQFLRASSDARASVPVEPSGAPILLERISVDLPDTTLAAALETIASRSGLHLMYSSTVAPLEKRVRLRAEDITVAAALTEVLLDTQVDVLFTGVGRAVLVRREPEPAAQAEPGAIVGRVTEVESGDPIVNAQIEVDGRGRTVTDRDGRYRVDGVEPGRRTVSVTSIGYGRASREVEVADGAMVTVDFALEVSPSQLDEVVVTVTGEQRVRELGHVVGRINADSVVREAPVSNVGELLNARVPGLQVLTTSGSVGGSVSLRLRSQGTIYLNPDPIVVVDGIRYTSGHPNTNQAPWGVEPTSRLNDLNPNDIESIEVVKGPSAAALYGTDAANGVIVIRTKRGEPGRARWQAYVRTGLTEVPDYRHPDVYWGWGSSASSCTLRNVTLGSCVQDSVTVLSTPLNDPELTVLATKPRYAYGASVSGGGENVQYYLSTDFENATGPVRLPPVMAAQLREELGGGELPESYLEPNTLEKLNVPANLTARFNEAAQVRVHAGYIQSDVRQFRLLGPYNMGPGQMRPDTDPYGDWDPITSFSQSSTERINRFTSSAAAEWLPAPWLQTRATIGLDLTSGQRYSLAPRDAWEGFTGQIGDDRTRTMLTTAELGATASRRVGRISSRTSVGAQYTRNLSDELRARGTDLRPGGASLVDASALTTNQFYSETVTLGTYVEQVVGLNDRLFVTGALRADGASTFGNEYQAALYPKVSASWIASEEPFIPRIPGVDELRFRYAFGSSGQQPWPDSRRVSFASGQGYVEPGSPVNNKIKLERLGNPDLRPERVREHEFGLDVAALEGRVQLDLTWNRRRTVDQLTFLPLPTGLGSIWTNLGLTEGHGFEAEFNASLLDTRAVGFSVRLSHATNADKLLDLGGNSASYGLTGSLVEGFPIGARFMRPLLGYDDANGDGILSVEEVQMGNTAIYVGRATPGQTQTLTPLIYLAQRRIRLSMLFERRSDFAQYDRMSSRMVTALRGAVDPTAPLAEQARIIARYAGQPPGQSAPSYNFFEDGDFIRWREASLAMDLPDSWAGGVRTDRVTVTVTGRNLLLWTKFGGPDPESARVSTTSGGEADYLPQARSWTIRLDIGF